MSLVFQSHDLISRPLLPDQKPGQTSLYTCTLMKQAMNCTLDSAAFEGKFSFQYLFIIYLIMYRAHQKQQSHGPSRKEEIKNPYLNIFLCCRSHLPWLQLHNSASITCKTDKYTKPNTTCFRNGLHASPVCTEMRGLSGVHLALGSHPPPRIVANC